MTNVSVNITDLQCLDRACEKLGLKLVRNKTEFKWFGRLLGGKETLPAGFTESEMGHCEHAISVPGNSKAYEVGVVRRRDGVDGWELHHDDWQGGFGLIDVVGESCHNLVQAYGVEVAKMAAMNAGYAIIGEEMVDGKCELLLSM